MAHVLLKFRTLCLLTAMACGMPAAAAQAQSFTTLYSFGASTGDGALPYAPLIFDASGALYGTTAFTTPSGGGNASGYGTVFKLTPPSSTGGTWSETVLYSFTGGSDGANPQAGLVSDASEALYGTTFGGGLSNVGTEVGRSGSFPRVESPGEDARLRRWPIKAGDSQHVAVSAVVAGRATRLANSTRLKSRSAVGKLWHLCH
jgi:hypothetical protein